MRTNKQQIKLLLGIIVVRFIGTIDSFKQLYITLYVITARRYAARGICYSPVGPFVLCRCVCPKSMFYERAKHIVTRTTSHDSSMSLVFCCQRSWWYSNGVTPM